MKKRYHFLIIKIFSRGYFSSDCPPFLCPLSSNPSLWLLSEALPEFSLEGRLDFGLTAHEGAHGQLALGQPWTSYPLMPMDVAWAAKALPSRWKGLVARGDGSTVVFAIKFFFWPNIILIGFLKKKSYQIFFIIIISGKIKEKNTAIKHPKRLCIFC